MDSSYVQPHFKARSISFGAGLFVSLLGATVLVGWAADIDALKIVFPGLAPMLSNAAAGFVLAGAALCMLCAAGTNAAARWLIRAAAALIVLLGVATLGEHVFGSNLGIDQLLVRVPADPLGMANPGRMPPLGAAGFVSFGSALLLLDRRHYAAAQVLALVTLSVSVIRLAGYLFGFSAIPTLDLAPPITFPAALCGLLLSLGILAFAAAKGFLRHVQAQFPAIGFASTLALFGLAAAALFVDTRRMADTAADVDDTHTVLSQINEVSLRVERVVAMTRVFILTGQEDFVSPLEGIERQIGDDLRVLRQLLAADSDQLARLAMLQDIVARRLALTDAYVDLRRTRGLQQAVDEIPAGGEELAAEFRATIAEMERAERMELEQNRAAAATSNASALTAMGFTVSLSLIVLLMAFAALRRQVAERGNLERAIVAASESERSRIGRDLHDGLGQELTGISFGLELLTKRLAAERSPHGQAAQELRAMVQSSISETRRIARSLSPGDWGNLGVSEALETLANEVNTHSAVNCRVQCSHGDDTHDPRVAAHLYRIAQEGINNALTHGNARSIDLRYRREGGAACLEVVDDGIGIPAEHERSEGLGLRSMRYRARMIDGSLDVEALAGGGTKVRCSFTYSPPVMPTGDLAPLHSP